MALAAGTRLGPYEIAAALGAGGMGEVYRARDAKLNRDVALKVLPQQFQLDVDRLARFKREAQVLASLSHPYHIYGIEDSGPAPALVLELVEGPTLAERLDRARTGLSLDEALEIARQIAEALEAAHEKGIVHRDLKPANVKITPDGFVKVLDFGLARLIEPEEDERESALSQSPTITIRGTREGVIIGTAAYMSPEQARGRHVDKRTDIWAFGCVLYEMLTGEAAFARDTVPDTLAAVLSQRPDWTKLPDSIPLSVRRLLERCLAKDPRQRLRDLGDAQIEIADVLATDSAHEQANVPRRRSSAWILVLVGTAIVTGAAVWRFTPRRSVAIPTSEVLTRLGIAPPSGTRLAMDAGAIALSPDGRRLAYVVQRGSRQQIYIREFDQFDAAPVAGTEGGYNPFFSPDGQWLGFFADGKLKKILPGTGQAVTILDVAIAGAGTPRWEADDTILVTPVIGSGIMRVAASGGKPTAVTTLALDESLHQWAQILPGGQALLFTAMGTQGPQIYAQSIATGQRRRLLQGFAAAYLPSGHLIFSQSGTLMALPFDPNRLETTGAPVAVLSGVLQASHLRNSSTSARLPQLSIASAGGTLAFVPANTGRRRSALVWVNRSGVDRLTAASGGDYSQPRLSPDGRRVAVTVSTDHDDVWLFDLSRQTWSRFTSEGNSSFPIWAPDGASLTYVSDKAGVENIYTRSVDGSSDRRLLVSERPSYPLSMSKDGTLALVGVAEGRAQDIWTLARDRKTPTPWLETAFSEGGAAFSPDGRWIAYVSNDSGRNDVYIRPYPGPGEKITISPEGGNEVMWARNGRELFYRNSGGLFAVDITTGPPLRAGKPHKLFENDYEPTASLWPNYDVSADGREFLMVKTLQDDAPAQVDVVLNWASELARRVPRP